MNISPPAMPPPPNASVILPDELIMEILSWLNVKSLMTMKCVCKSWNTLISDPLFVKMHLYISKRNPHLALLSNRYTRTSTVATISVTCLLENTFNSIEPYFKFNSIGCDGIVGSCNGLICLHNYYLGIVGPCDGLIRLQIKHWFYFCNPVTRTKSETVLSLLWDSNLGFETIRFGFGYDSSKDRYKAVMLGFKIDGDDFRNQVKTTFKVFTLGDNIWRDIPSFFPVEVVLSTLIYIDFKYDGVYLSNSIFWLFQNNLKFEQFVIISLDLGTETFTQFLLPSCCDELVPLDNPTLSVLMDSICFSYYFRAADHFVIWQMKEFGVEESWTQLLKISYGNLEMNYEFDYNFTLQVLPLYLSENDATLILATNVRNQAILYNWRDNRVKKVGKANGISWSTAKGYVESLVSTC